jgi:hypothetical protein
MGKDGVIALRFAREEVLSSSHDKLLFNRLYYRFTITETDCQR